MATSRGLAGALEPRRRLPYLAPYSLPFCFWVRTLLSAYLISFLAIRYFRGRERLVISEEIIRRRFSKVTVRVSIEDKEDGEDPRVHLIGVYLVDVCLMGVYLMGVHLMSVSPARATARPALAEFAFPGNRT